jgi:hypothetical protein
MKPDSEASEFQSNRESRPGAWVAYGGHMGVRQPSGVREKFTQNARPNEDVGPDAVNHLLQVTETHEIVWSHHDNAPVIPGGS